MSPSPGDAASNGSTDTLRNCFFFGCLAPLGLAVVVFVAGIVLGPFMGDNIPADDIVQVPEGMSTWRDATYMRTSDTVVVYLAERDWTHSADRFRVPLVVALSRIYGVDIWDRYNEPSSIARIGDLTMLRLDGPHGPMYIMPVRDADADGRYVGLATWIER